MKTTSNFRPFITATLLLLLCTTLTANAQISTHRFSRLFSQAFEQVVYGQYHSALPTFEILHRSHPDHGQVAYLLALCYLKQGTRLETSMQLLQTASTQFNPLHQHGCMDDRSAPSRVWLLLGDAFIANGRNKEAIDAYRTYMTNISMESIEHKRKVVERIRSARQTTEASVVAMNLKREIEQP